MILLGKRLKLDNYIKPGLILLISVFYGCETSEDPGVDYSLDSNIEVNFKEFLLPSSNVYIDSLRTDGENKILVGNYSDPVSGSVKAEGYMSLTYVNSTIPGDVIEFDYTYDSARISFMSPKAIKEDGILTQSFVFSQLSNSLSSNLIYLSSMGQDTLRQIGSFDYFVVNPRDTFYCNALLSDEFGQDLMNFGKISGNLNETEFPSIGISASSESDLLSSITMNNDTARLYLYVTHPDGITEIMAGDTTQRDTTYQVEFIFSGTNYSHIERDRAGSEFANIEENVDFTLSTGQTYIDPLFGLSTSYRIDELAEFFDENNDIIINTASILYELDDNDGLDTLSSFMSYIRKEDGDFFGPAISNSQFLFQNILLNSASYSGQSPEPAFGQLNTDKTTISLEGTGFHKLLLRSFQDTGNLQIDLITDSDPRDVSELVILPVQELNLQRTIFKKDGIKLRIYYSVVD